MMEALYRYLMIVIACSTMLAGIQVPNLVDQYEKRVDAHLREVRVNLNSYQAIADKYTGGSLEQLIELHRKSDNPAFRAEGQAITDMLLRRQRFEAAYAAMQATLPVRIYHFLLNGDRELMEETFQQYTYAVPLNQDALVVGAASVAIMMVLTELLLALARYLADQAVYRFRRGTAS